jgi:hypothetical protein
MTTLDSTPVPCYLPTQGTEELKVELMMRKAYPQFQDKESNPNKIGFPFQFEFATR